MTEVERLEKRLHRCLAITQRVREQLREARLAAAPVQIGDKVMFRGAVYMVVDIEMFMLRKPWLRGVPRKKNGEWSRRIRHLYADWSVIDD